MTISADMTTTPDKGPDRDWWRGAVIYQIYPRSFQDSNGDGIGDLKGISARLPHVAALGADAIWISPFFPSPMKDFGYDVSNYMDVDPMFGSLSDFDGLIAEAHRLGLKVMIDLVMSHSSDQHAWFVESRSSRFNPKADWYVWADARPDGTPPNNWLSIFGGSAWAWDPTRMQYFMHNFLTSQPDLNLHNPEVQDALLDMTRFWLKRGVDGFRLDTINFYFHDKELRDNPALEPSRRNASTAPAVNPYNFQEHIYDKNRPENLEFLKRFRAVLDEFPAIAAVGEVGDSQRGLEIVGEYTSGDDKMQMCYAFEFLAPDPLTPARVAEVQSAFQSAASEGWACWAFSNHDVCAMSAAGGRKCSTARLSPRCWRHPSVAARFCLPLSGRGTGPDRSRYRLRRPARPLWHPVLAGIQGPRWLPHADGMGCAGAAGRLFHGGKDLASHSGRTPAAGCRRAIWRSGIGAGTLPPLPRLPQIASGLCQGRYPLPAAGWRASRL